MTVADDYLETCRQDFAAFSMRAYCELFDTDLIWNWHLDVMCDSLAKLWRGEVSRQLVLVPPRSLKSFLCSVAWPAFLLGHNPALKILAVSYAQPLADDLARHCQDLMMSDWYKGLFKTRLMNNRQPIDNLRTTKRGYRLATLIAGTLTGRGADLIIIDDPLKADDALSEPMRRNAETWFRNTLPSRTDNKKEGKMLVVMQRLHQDDPAGFLIEAGWPALALPAIAPQDTSFTYLTLLGSHTKRWKEGEALQIEREPIEVLETLRADMGSFSFSAQYLQDPAPVEGNIVKRDWFRTYDAAITPAFDQIVQSWDTASKSGEANDYSVCTTWGVKGTSYYLIDVYRRKLEFPDLVYAVQDQAALHRASVVLIEDKGSGTSLLQQLQVTGFGKARAFVPRLDKAARLIGTTPIIERGQVFLPNVASWKDEYLHELCGFPAGKHDDQVDSTSQTLEWLRDQGNPGGLFFFYQQAHEARLARQNDRTVQLKAPRNVNQVILRDGQQIPVNFDGTVWVSEADAGPLGLAGYIRLS